MCGIVAILSSAAELDRSSFLPAAVPDPERLDDLKEALGQLAYPQIRDAYSDPTTHTRWRDLAEELRSIGGDAGARSDAGPEDATARLCREFAWRIEHDLLELVDRTSALLQDPGRQEGAHAVWLAWQTELTLRALGRLEVRGRDSAGLSLLLWFPDADVPERLVSSCEPVAAPAEEAATGRSVVPGTNCLHLTFKVAEEVGTLGHNEATLRALITRDDCFQRAVRAMPSHGLVLAHTRWASNGLINIDNAHPVDGLLEPLEEEGLSTPAGRTLAVINGDVDNYQEVARDIRSQARIPVGVTTDAKALPALIELERCGGADPDAALLSAVEQIEGSLASVIVRADRPGALWCALRGTGQSLYLAAAGDTVMVVSEVYGCVEMTDHYWPVDQGRQGEEPVVLCVELPEDGAPRFDLLLGPRAGPIQPHYQPAAITTRDVDRRGFTHFFRKELEEAIDSVRKTITARYHRTSASVEEPGVDFSALYDRWPETLIDSVTKREIRRFVFIGQGSAHVAGSVGARFMADRVVHMGIASTAMTAGDFSAHELRSDLEGTCLVAISQSGTTTDTNRCVTLARKRGARVIGIVNRRNSTLVDLCDAVIYTSDGRDVEMAVASTKAFYCQVAASFMLSQHIGLLTGGQVPSQSHAALSELERLPEVMGAAFRLEPEVAECARRVGLKRRHWSLLGSGHSMAAADEIRIKFSELCYKSVSVDYLENKKHIDLSAEPLILAALPDLRSDLISDAAKEVSIFAAHQAITVVFCDREGDAYRPYTPYVLEIPPIGCGLAVVTTAILGHLFAYHTAIAMDAVAQRLRHLRKTLIQSASETDPSLWTSYSPAAADARQLHRELLRGDFNALWPAHAAARLGAVFRLIAGAADVELILLAGAPSGTSPFEWSRNQLSESIAEATRSIDSIRHQAKTITVGTSRAGYSRTSVLERALSDLGVDIEDLGASYQWSFLAVDEILEKVPAGVRYALDGENPEDGELSVVAKIGWARQATSRFERGAPISGTKLACVRHRQLMVVNGIRDDARLLVFPILKQGTPVELVLLHLKLRPLLSAKKKLRFLQAFPQRAERLVEHFEEILGHRVSIGQLAELDIESLAFARVGELAGGDLEPVSAEKVEAS